MTMAIRNALPRYLLPDAVQNPRTLKLKTPLHALPFHRSSEGDGRSIALKLLIRSL